MNFGIDFCLVEKLSKDAKPLWGKMSPQHMIEHLTLAVKTSNGNFPIEKCINPPEKFELLKRFLLSPRPLPQNFVNPLLGEGLQPLNNINLESAIAELKNETDIFFNYFIKNPNSQPINATFGPLNFEEWKIFHKKHFTHHFTQFGLIK